MAKLRVFISSTYYDLKHIRSTIESFVESLGYDAILSEKGGIAYNPDMPLDESCYRDAQACDIFVLIVGGRYGSAASSERKGDGAGLPESYASITKKEFDAAIEKDVPVYILVEKGVYGEYETFKRNRKAEIDYAHVDSINVFKFLDQIFSKPRNNPVHHFDKHTEIIEWLRLQWSGLFKDILQRRSESKQISSLSAQVKYLEELNTTLKRYMEALMKTTDTKENKELISSESKRLSELEKNLLLKENYIVHELQNFFEFTFKQIIQLIKEAQSIEDFIEQFNHLSRRGLKEEQDIDNIINKWKRRDNKNILTLNNARSILGLPPLKFRDEN